MVNQLLQTNDLAYIRAEAKKALPDFVSVQRKTLTGDGQGGYSESWSDAYQNVPARLSQTGSEESNTAGRQDWQADFMLTVSYDQSIEQTDRIVHTSGTYEIQGIDTGKSWSATKQCKMRQL